MHSNSIDRDKRYSCLDFTNIFRFYFENYFIHYLKKNAKI
jgi:hypothetical protein